MRLDQLNQLIEIARLESISRAAEKLYISQPALSASIKGLEMELGKVLFKRTNKGICLTADGEQICAEAITIKAILDGWREKRAENEPEGEIHVASVPVVSSYITANLIVPFHKLYPKITVCMHNVLHFDVVGRLKTTNASIAVTTLSLYSKLVEELTLLEWEKCMLATDERRLFLGATHPLASKAELKPEDLKILNFAWYSDSKDQVSSGYAQYFASSYRLANKEDLLALVIMNEAAFIQSSRIFRKDWRMEKKLLVERRIPLPDVDARTSIYAFHAPDLSDIEHLFWEYLVEYFPKYL